MTIESTLKNLDPSSMARLIGSLYGIYGEIDEIIETHLEVAASASGDGHRIADSLARRLAQIADEDDFIDYHGGHSFSCRLQALLLDINTLLREQSLAQALELTENFLHLADSIFERADDSDGDIGMVFSEAIDQWLEIAAELRRMEPNACNWVDKVLNFFDHNDYGCFDNVIAHSRYVLTEEELRQLAWRFENQARKALGLENKESEQNERGYNLAAAHACIGLQSVAEALDDMALCEKSTLITSPQPNTLQLAAIVQFAMEINELERAHYWLQQPQWQEDEHRQAGLHNELLKLQGNMEQLKQNLLDNFLRRPSDATLNTYLEFADPQEQASIKAKVEVLAQDSENVQDAISMLLTVDNSAQAADLVIQHADALPRVYYSMLLHWAELFADSQHTLAAIVCYRALLTDLLDRGYSKAYHHGARYFHKLLALDKHTGDYHGLDSAQSFIRQIQQKHWRKRSFWAEADYPNKPE